MTQTQQQVQPRFAVSYKLSSAGEANSIYNAVLEYAKKQDSLQTAKQHKKFIVEAYSREARKYYDLMTDALKEIGKRSGTTSMYIITDRKFTDAESVYDAIMNNLPSGAEDYINLQVIRIYNKSSCHYPPL